MPNNILFVFEGEKTEKQIVNSLTKYLLKENEVIQCVYCNDIYELHKVISDDKDLDTFALLKEIPQNSGLLSNFKRSDFAEIYMFFDYDGHDTLADDEKVKELLTFFNEETSVGKLYLSYPMIEAIKHIKNTEHFKNLKVKAKENIKYKKLVNTEAKNEFKHFKKYTLSTWKELVELHLMKANYINSNSFTLPKTIILQIDLFINQLEKFISVDQTISVVSPFPLFLFDYYGLKFISEFLSEEV